MSEAKFRTLGDIGTFVRGNGLQKKDFVDSGIPCIHYGQVHTYYGTLVERTISFVVPEVADKLRKAQKGDIVIVCTSENVEDVCKCIAWLGDEDVCIGGETYIFKHNQDPKYLAYYFQTNAFSEFKKKNSTGTKVFRVHESALKDFLIPLPPLDDQKKIGGVLSSVDELLASLDKQVAKTRDIKQGVMQQLLTGKTRLAGFSSQWTESELKTHATICKGIQFNKADMNVTGSYPVINGGIEASGYIEQYNNNEDTITVSQGGASAGYVNWLSQKFWAGAHCYVVKPDESVDNKYLYYVLKFNELAFMGSKYGGNIPALSVSTLLDFSMPVPPLEEQKHIASVLSSLDGTITGLEAKRQKYESVKAGMMQQLLTGAIRLN